MVYFISGHRDITEEEFQRNYIFAIDKALNSDINAKFVVGDYQGVDIMAQQYLKKLGLNNAVSVYHMFDKPRNLASNDFCLVGGFKTDIERDTAMTIASDYDIAFVRKGKWDSGTAQNIKRRHNLK